MLESEACLPTRPGHLTTPACVLRAASGTAHFAHGMCKECFEDYLKVSGGQAADSALPPAFASAETQVCRRPYIDAHQICTHALMLPRWFAALLGEGHLLAGFLILHLDYYGRIAP